MIDTSNIIYYDKNRIMTPNQQRWLERKGRLSYSGGELRPIIIDNKFIGGISWNLGGIDYIQFTDENKNKGYLKYIIYDNIDDRGVVKFVTASPELQDKLKNYGEIRYNPNTDITELKAKMDKVNKKSLVLTPIQHQHLEDIISINKKTDMKIKKFEQFVNENNTELDYDEILNGIKKYGWGDLSSERLEEFEKSDFYKKPRNENEYIEQLNNCLYSESIGQ